MLTINVFRIVNLTNLEDLVAHRLSIAWSSFFRKGKLPHQQDVPKMFAPVEVPTQGLSPEMAEIIKAC